jgi:hypothetical protein
MVLVLVLTALYNEHASQVAHSMLTNTPNEGQEQRVIRHALGLLSEPVVCNDCNFRPQVAERTIREKAFREVKRRGVFLMVFEKEC